MHQQLSGSAWVPSARQLHRESQVVQEQIRRNQQKQDFQKKHEQRLQHQHTERKPKILIVANRLPTKPVKDSEGKWQFEKCAGGLVSCIGGLQGRLDMVWIGWTGVEIQEADKEEVAAEAMKQNCYPVFLDQDTIDNYYNGFANNVLWPLFHYIMPPFDKGVNECSAAQFEAYKRANEFFTDAVLQVYEDGDYVWIHDYHLMLVPKLLRSEKPDCNMGWFCHTPFPSAEIYRTLPWRLELIESLLHANLLGFHVYDYLRHFMSSCSQLTSLEISAHSVDATSIGGCIVTCATIPVGIDPQEITKALATEEVKQEIDNLRTQYGDRKVILGVDRLDYTKGIPHKLMAFGAFLDMHPDWANKCVLVQLAVPSRRDVPEYQRLQRQVHELVGQVCGRHSSLQTGAPVIYMDDSMSFDKLVALYQVADVALITSLRDGMNLVSYEFIASHYQRDPPGVLILSEFTGAAQSLGAGSLRINPWNLQETANAIHEALDMAAEDRQALFGYAFQYVNEHTSSKWGATFLQSLQEACSDLQEVTAEVPPMLPYEELLTEWSESTRRLIIIDLLECLAPVKHRPGTRSKVGRRMIHMPSELQQCLSTIASSPDTTVLITTDKSRQTLEQVTGALKVLQAAEGCCVFKKPGDSEWTPLIEESDVEGREEWMEGVQVIFDYFRERTPGSYIEKQEYQYRWCWDNTQFDFGSAQAREALIHLWAGPLVNSEAEVVVGDRSITVRPHACSRSACLERLLTQELGEDLQGLDFVLCFAAVSHRDEDVFEMLQNLIEDRDIASSAPLERLSEEDLDNCAAPSTVSPTSQRPETPPIQPSCTDSPRPAIAGQDNVLQTPPGPQPAIAPGEPPPDYDWIPTAQREMQGRPERSVEASPMLLPPSVQDSDERPFACYTLSLGMKKTKAQHALPHPYHVQNLIRAMAARLPPRPEEAEVL